MSLPLTLTALRAGLAPVVVLLALVAPSKPLLGACLVAAFVSDVLDGVLTRRLGIESPLLRRLDSVADTLFYAAAGIAAWVLHPSAVLDRRVPLAILAGLEVGRYVLDAVKFRREASYHMGSSKAWGVALFAGLFSLLALGRENVLLDVAVYAGIVADLEGVAISLTLRGWRSDVPSIVHALRIRRAERP